MNGCHHLVTSSAVDSFGVLTIVMLLDLFGFIGICIWLAVCGRCLRVVCYGDCSMPERERDVCNHLSETGNVFRRPGAGQICRTRLSILLNQVLEQMYGLRRC